MTGFFSFSSRFFLRLCVHILLSTHFSDYPLLWWYSHIHVLFYRPLSRYRTHFWHRTQTVKYIASVNTDLYGRMILLALTRRTGKCAFEVE